MTRVWGLSCNFSMTSNNELAYVFKQKILLSLFCLLLCFLIICRMIIFLFFLFFCKASIPQVKFEFVIYQQQKNDANERHLIWHFSSIIFFLIVIKWISLYFILLFSLMELFFGLSSFSCETLYGELHLFFHHHQLVLKDV